MKREPRLYKFTEPVYFSNGTGTSATNAVTVFTGAVTAYKPNPFHGSDRWLFAFDEWLHRSGLVVVNGAAAPWWGRFARRYCDWWDRRIGPDPRH